MTEWKEVELQQIADVQTGPFGSQLKNEQYITGGTPVVTVEHLKDFRIIDFNYPSVTDEDKNRLSKYLLKQGDIVFTRVGSVDLSAFVKKHQDGWMFSSRMLRVRTNAFEVDSRFLSYYFQQKNFRDYILNISVGATMPSINTEILKAIPVSYPSLPEQKSIASILSSLDDKIDLLHRQNATLEKMAETLFRQWFVEEAKEEWENCNLEDLCTQINSGGTPLTKIESYYNGNINWYSTKELNDNYLFESISKITQDGLDNSSAKLFPKGTVLIAIYAAPTVGRLGILGNQASFNQAACGLVANNKICCKEFIYLFLKSQRDELNAMASGSAQQNLNVGKIKSYPSFIPDEMSMAKFKKKVVPLFDKIEKNAGQIRTLTSLQDTLLPKLMSGEVTVEM